RPGRVVVKSAGNEFGMNGHAETSESQGAVSNLSWDSKDTHPRRGHIEAWFDSSMELRFCLETPHGSRTMHVDVNNPNVVREPLDNNLCSLILTQYHIDNGDSSVLIEIERSPSQRIHPGEWKLWIEGNSVPMHNHKIHLWVDRVSSASFAFHTTSR